MPGTELMRTRRATTLAAVVLGLGAALSLTPYVARAAAHVPVALMLSKAAGTCPEAGPLFLGNRCRPLASTAIDQALCSTDDPQGCYLHALARQSQGKASMTELGRAVAARYRSPFADTLLVFQLDQAGATGDARRLWMQLGDPVLETLLVGAGTLNACHVAARVTLDGPAASFCLGVLYRASGRLDEALAWLQRALPGAPLSRAPTTVLRDAFTRADVLYRIAETELARGHVEEARRLTAECLEADPDHYWGRFQWAMIAAQSGHRDEAIRDLHRLVERYPHHAAAMVNLGLLHEAAGDAASAEYWLLRARPLLPDKELADGPLRRLRTPSSGSPR